MIEEVFDDYDTNEDGLDKEELKGGEICRAGRDASPAHHLLQVRLEPVRSLPRGG